MTRIYNQVAAFSLIRAQTEDSEPVYARLICCTKRMSCGLSELRVKLIRLQSQNLIAIWRGGPLHSGVLEASPFHQLILKAWSSREVGRHRISLCGLPLIQDSRICACLKPSINQDISQLKTSLMRRMTTAVEQRPEQDPWHWTRKV